MLQAGVRPTPSHPLALCASSTCPLPLLRFPFWSRRTPVQNLLSLTPAHSLSPCSGRAEEVGKRSNAELCFPGLAEKTGFWVSESHSDSAYPWVSSPPLHYPSQSWAWGKVWVFEGAAVFPMSGFSTLDSWTFDGALICLLLTGLQFGGCWEGLC